GAGSARAAREHQRLRMSRGNERAGRARHDRRVEGGYRRRTVRGRYSGCARAEGPRLERDMARRGGVLVDQLYGQPVTAPGGESPAARGCAARAFDRVRIMPPDVKVSGGRRANVRLFVWRSLHEDEGQD